MFVSLRALKSLCIIFSFENTSGIAKCQYELLFIDVLTVYRGPMLESLKSSTIIYTLGRSSYGIYIFLF